MGTSNGERNPVTHRQAEKGTGRFHRRAVHLFLCCRDSRFYWRVSQERDTGYLVAEILPLVVAASFAGFHLARDRLSPVVRAVLLSGLLLMCSVAGLVARGILGPAFCFMLLAVICLCLILPLRQILLAASVIFATNLAVVTLHLTGRLSITSTPPGRSPSPPPGWRTCWCLSTRRS